MYLFSYILMLVGLFGLAAFHPEPKFQLALILLMLANGVFLWR
jgi:hypothetical protein